MLRKVARQWIAILGVLFACAPAVFPVPPLRLGPLIEASDVVAVVDIRDIRTAGSIRTVTGGQSVQSTRFVASMALRYGIKGECPGRLEVAVVLPDGGGGYRGFQYGTRVVFLRHVADEWTPTDPYYPDLPAAGKAVGKPTNASAGPDLTGIVISEVAEVLASASSSDNDKLAVLGAAYAIPKDSLSFNKALAEGLKVTSSPELRARMMAQLILRGDLTQVAAARRLLLTSVLSANEEDILLYAIANEPRDPGAVPLLGALVRADDPRLRRAATEALWHIADSSGLELLAMAVSDSDRLVRYYAVRGLADTTGQFEWGPGPGEWEQNERRYVDHSLEWSKRLGGERRMP